MIAFLPAQVMNAVCNQRTNLLLLISKAAYFVIKDIFKIFR